jgi:hypothetical protein
MWKTMVLMVGLVGCLTLSAHGAEPLADQNGDKGKLGISVSLVTREGKLTQEDPWKGAKEYGEWGGLGLQSGDHWYGLDFGANEELLKQMEKLNVKKARVTGLLTKRTLKGMIPHTIDVLVVTELQPVEAIQKTVQVEIKGQLRSQFRCPMCITNRVNGVRDYLSYWEVVVNETTYELYVGDNKDLRDLAEKLTGQTVIVTGTREGEVVHVKSLKADEDFVKKTVHVEVKGLLKRRLRQCVGTLYSLTAGKDYFGIEFASTELQKQAEQLNGTTVIVTGTLAEDAVLGKVITVTALKADAGSIKETVTVEVKGRLVCETVYADCYPPKSFTIWEVRAEGQRYQLDFGGNKQLQRQAKDLRGTKVILKGILKDGTITVTSMESAEDYWIGPLPHETPVNKYWTGPLLPRPEDLR